MAKVTLQVEDTVKYTTDITIELPSYMSEEEFDSHLDSVERKFRGEGMSDDMISELSSMGFNIVETVSGFPNSPDRAEVEIVDVRDVKDDA